MSDVIYRCGKCYDPVKIPVEYMYKDIDKDDGWLRATGKVNTDCICIDCQIKEMYGNKT